MKKILLMILRIYEKFFTVINYGNCRYYPTCSQYAKWQILHNSTLKALFFTFLRILRCNQFFKGGIDYPIVKKKVTFNLNKEINSNIKIIFWFVPLDNKKFYVIKTI